MWDYGCVEVSRMAAEWINRRKEQEQKDKQDAQLEDAKDQLAAQVVKTEGPLYWESLLPDLTEQCSDLDAIGYQAKATPSKINFVSSRKRTRSTCKPKGTGRPTPTRL